jgi:hypothetical protein
MKKIVLSTALAVATFAAANTASAAILKYNGLAGSASVSVSGDGPDYSGIGGAFRMEDIGNALGLGTDFIAF